MNVYPINEMLAIKTIASSQASIFSDPHYIYHNYLGIKTEFKSDEAVISGTWDVLNPAVANSFIIANTNAIQFRMIFRDVDDSVLYDSGEKYLYDYINIYKIGDLYGIFSFELSLIGNENLYLGYLFIGKRITLPRFTVNPVNPIELRSEINRSQGGYSQGVYAAPLEGFGASFLRIEDDEAALIKAYVKSILNIQPHVIDPYEEAHDHFHPMYATLVEGLEFTKRSESGFFWDFNLSWQEAK